MEGPGHLGTALKSPLPESAQAASTRRRRRLRVYAIRCGGATPANLSVSARGGLHLDHLGPRGAGEQACRQANLWLPWPWASTRPPEPSGDLQRGEPDWRRRDTAPEGVPVSGGRV